MKKKEHLVMVTRYGFAYVEADSESDALNKARNLKDEDFDWSEWDNEQIVEEDDDEEDDDYKARSGER